jgi:bifunctional DNA-binding transcriptional regulator/antitoxin component of YhaV-PrlF toxin-antitoxin module
VAIAVYAVTAGGVGASGVISDRHAMATLTVTARGQVTFRRDVLQHLGVRPGEKIELDKLPDGRITLRAARPAGVIDGFPGLLGGETFVSFDKKTVALIAKHGQQSRLLA